MYVTIPEVRYRGGEVNFGLSDAALSAPMAERCRTEARRPGRGARGARGRDARGEGQGEAVGPGGSLTRMDFWRRSPSTPLTGVGAVRRAGAGRTASAETAPVTSRAPTKPASSASRPTASAAAGPASACVSPRLFPPTTVTYSGLASSASAAAGGASAKRHSTLVSSFFSRAVKPCLFGGGI